MALQFWILENNDVTCNPRIRGEIWKMLPLMYKTSTQGINSTYPPVNIIETF